MMAGSQGVEIAQNSDPYQTWEFLYRDAFEDSSGVEITQEWKLKPRVQRTDNLLKFTLLARRLPVSTSGVAAAVFDYAADCDAMAYALEKATHIDSSNSALGSQTYGAVMETADRSSNPNFYDVLDKLCKGQLPSQ